MSTSLSIQALFDGDDDGGRLQGSLPFATQASTRTMLPIIPRPDKDRGYDVSEMDLSTRIAGADTSGPEAPSSVPRTNSLHSQRGTQPDTDELHSPRSRHEKGHDGVLTADVDQGLHENNLNAVEKTRSSKKDCKAQNQQDHVCGCQSQRLTGWAAAEKTLTDLDQREVGGFKEDIDSLLTFAGLYSGVLTAFVIVSFTQLQEDTAGETLNVLRIIANQTTNAAATVLTAPPPFQPSLAAKRVNVLWFASLIISLSTASLAILSKQWLRGYMAFASSSPQGQLRIRHFRRSGLETWRVFGIVSMLPLLLQISLALFFVGLCFFTADIDPAIGNTALLLVCAWAFLFVTVTVSPIFSARCPYKTPALLAITTALRVHVWCKLRHYARSVLAISAGILFLSFLKVLKIIRDIFGIWKDFVGAYQEREDNVISKMTAILKEEISSQEEAESLNKPSNDLIILLSADAAQANLELDLVIMEDALKHSNPRWDEVVHFLVQIMGNRTPLLDEFTEGPQTSLIDCRLLSARTMGGIMGLLSQYVANSDELASSNAQNIGSSWDSLGPAKQWTICMFLSLREPDSDQMPGVLHPLFAAWFSHFALRNAFSSGWQFHLVFPPQEVSLLCLWIKLGYAATQLPQNLDAIKDAFDSIDMIHSHTRRRYAHDLAKQGHSNSTKTPGSLCSNAARKFGNDLFSYYWKQDTQVKRGEFGWDLSKTVLALCRFAEDLGDIGLYKSVLMPFLKEAFLRESDEAVKDILVSMLGLYDFGDESWHRPRRISDCQFLLEIARSQGPEAHTSLMNALCLVAAEDCWTATRFLAFSTAALQFLKSDPHGLVDSPSRILWRRLFLLLAQHWNEMRASLQLNLVDSICIDGQPEDHLSDLIAIGEEVDIVIGSANLSAEQRRTSPIPDIFCLALGTLVEEKGKPPIWTADYLRGISTQERETIIAEGKVEIDAALQAVWDSELRERAAEDAQVEIPSAEDSSSASQPHPTEAGPSRLLADSEPLLATPLAT